MLHLTQPIDFKAKLIAVGCMVEYHNKLLFLRRHPKRSYPGKWGCAAGGQEPGETPLQTAVRELHEETGIIVGPQELTYCGERFVRYPNDQDFIYHQFWLPLSQEPEVVLNPREHDAFQWVTRDEAARMDYLGEPNDILECLRMIPSQV